MSLDAADRCQHVLVMAAFPIPRYLAETARRDIGVSDWIADLPAIVADLARRWSLRVRGGGLKLADHGLGRGAGGYADADTGQPAMGCRLSRVTCARIAASCRPAGSRPIGCGRGRPGTSRRAHARRG